MAIILNPGTLADKIREAGIALEVLDESRENVFQLTRAVNQYVTANRPDLIHCHRLKENIIGGLVAARHGIPSVRTLHGASEHGFGAFNIRKRVLHDIDYLCGRFLQKKIIAVSEPLARQLCSKYPPPKVCLIHNGLDLGHASSHVDSKFQQPLRIGIVGRLVPVKRVDIFLEVAAAVLANASLEQKPDFQVIGDGPLRAQLEKRADELELNGQLEFVGHVDNAEEQIAQLDVLVLCSDHEGLPMVALESMKHKTLVLTHPIGGLPQLLDDGRCGYLVEKQAASSFVEAIHAIANDGDGMRNRTDMARQRLEDHYSSEAMARDHIDLYQQLIAPG
jgi:glycosyltransferase involved in cell wall biosynthesis